MIELMPETAGRIIAVRLAGQVTSDDHEAIRPRLQEFQDTSDQPLRLLVDLSTFEGNDGVSGSEAEWFEACFGDQIERLALIADSQWDDEVVRYRDAFTTATVQRFDPADSVGARAWVANGD